LLSLLLSRSAVRVCRMTEGARGSRCYFPDDWKGQYFQSGLGSVMIRKSVITTKGTCVDQHRDYFLFANRSISRGSTSLNVL